MLNMALKQRSSYGRRRQKFTGKERDAETGLYYYGARYLDPKTGRWLSGDPAMGEYLPVAPVNDEAKKRNGNLPGQGGVFNYVNLHAYHYAGNNPVKYVDPDGNSKWIKIEGTDWWFRADSSHGGDRPHFHFGKGKDPKKSNFEVYNRRVYVQDKKSDNSNTPQRPHGRDGLDKDVPEDIIQKAVNQKKTDIISESVSVPEPLFGLLGVERLESNKVRVENYEEIYPLWGNGNPLELHYSVTRDRETGVLNFTFDYAVDLKTGNIILGGIYIPVVPGTQYFPTPSPSSSLIPILGF